MRVIITGGTGLIGGALAADLAKDNHEIIVLTRNPEQTTSLPGGVHLERWDAKTAEGWGTLAEGADAIVNLAGESIAGEGFFPSRWTEERKRRIRESRINVGKAIVEAVEQAQQKPGVVIQSSAVGYYGTQSSQDLTEDAPPGNDFLAKVCVDWENATAPVETMGVRRVITRTGLVLSRHGGALPRMALPFRLFAGGPIGSGKQQTSWIHQDDEIAAIRFLIENREASGAFNLCAPNPLTNAEFSQAMGKAMGRPSFIPIPGFAFRTMFGEVSMVLLEGQRVIPKRLQEMGFTFKFTEAEAALRDIFGHKTPV